ncbi:hypothetical protein ABPG72_009151 [Tetrahymena utriculariae]
MNETIFYKIAIFDSALNFVQEREEPVDFIDIFFDYETKKEDLGIFDDILQIKHQNKKLSPLKQKNLSSSYMNNSDSNSMSATIDYISNKSQSFVNQLQNSNKNQNTGRQLKSSKLSPLNHGFQSPQSRLTNNLSINQNGSQSYKNLKQSIDTVNSVKEQQQYFNREFLNEYLNKETQKQQQIYESQAFENGEKGGIDDMYKNSLFRNNLNRLRLQQIQFYPSPPQKSKAFSNHFNQSIQQTSQFNEPTQSQMLYDMFDQNHPYSLKQGNNFLKEHFNLQIKNVPDPRKKWVVRKINKQPINSTQASSQHRDEKNTKFSQNQTLFISNDNQQLSTQTDESNAFEMVQKSVQCTRDQMIIKSLNPQLLNKNNFFQTGFDFNSQNQEKNGFINLNNLMISINSPTFFFNQDQFFNQNFSPKTAPSQSRKDKPFQIKKFQPQTASFNAKSEQSKTFFKESLPQNNPLMRQKLNKVKSDLYFSKQKQNQILDDNINNNQHIIESSKLQNKQKKQNTASKIFKQENQSNPNDINGFLPCALEQLIDNNPKVLPIYCLNFSRALEKRLLLNSLGV